MGVSLLKYDKERNRLNPEVFAFVIVGVFLIPIFVGYIIHLPQWGLSEAARFVWIGFLGSYIGGVTGGLVAFFVARMQVNQIRKESEELHKQFYAAIESDLAKLEFIVPSFQHYLKYSSHSYVEKKQEMPDDLINSQQVIDLEINFKMLKKLHEDFENSLTPLKSYGLSDIPPPVAFEYHALLRGAYRIDNQIRQFLNYEDSLLSSLDKVLDKKEKEMPNELAVFLADNKRICENFKTHQEFLENKIKNIRNAMPKEMEQNDEEKAK